MITLYESLCGEIVDNISKGASGSVGNTLKYYISLLSQKDSSSTGGVIAGSNDNSALDSLYLIPKCQVPIL